MARPPKPPAYLDELAAQQWKAKAKQLAERGDLTPADWNNLELFCVNYSMYRKAVEDLASRGFSIVNSQGGESRNPALSAKADAEKIMLVTNQQSLVAQLELATTEKQRTAIRGLLAKNSADLVNINRSEIATVNALAAANQRLNAMNGQGLNATVFGQLGNLYTVTVFRRPTRANLQRNRDVHCADNRRQD